jgi:D-beta-D-heptose 7-phosphate kinase/D-beta-D-heptose 1-phosphate adenosyltransferase
MVQSGEFQQRLPLSWEDALAWRRRLADEGRHLVFTNGCFDILHAGHVDLLERARSFGNALVVGLNDDASVEALKGPSRPIVPQQDRAAVLLGLEAVDAVVLFGQPTPRELIAHLLPDVLVKGGDWKPEEVVGREEVEAQGGRVEIVPLVEGRSTTSIVERVLERHGRT